MMPRRCSSACWPRSVGSTARSTARSRIPLASLAQVRIAQKNFAEAEKLIGEALDAQRLGEHRLSEDRVPADHAGHRADAQGEAGSTPSNCFARRSTLFAKEPAAIINTSLPPSTTSAKRCSRSTSSRMQSRAALGDGALEAHRRAVWRSARSASALGEALHRQGRTDEAEQYLVDSYRDLTADPGGRQRQQAHRARTNHPLLCGPRTETETGCADARAQQG